MQGLQQGTESTSSGFSKLKGIAAKLGIAAAAAKAAKAVVDLGKQSLQLYSQYEQLTGGIETLFGESQDKVMQYAENAYKTAGMSANQYMDTVTSFSASLLQSLGGDTDAAAEKADLAITDMSDNANKMGSSMESIQNAYQGFAKQNYTMLDNLKLGYGGTKEEMQRLLSDAEKITGKKFDISNYADVVDAIHAVQTEMGITGTTAEEASTTIEGSINSMKASWENLLTGMANGDADQGQLIDNFIDSVKTAASNIIPAIETIAPNLITGLLDLITQAANAIMDNAPQFLSAGLDLVIKLAEGLANGIPKLLEKVPMLIAKLVVTIIQALPKLVVAGVKLALALIKGMLSYIGKMKDAGKALFNGVWDGLKGIWSSISSWVSEKVSWLVDKLAFWRKGKKETDGSKRTGLREVPFDGYVAELHKGEMVLTAAEANQYQKKATAASTRNYTINFNGNYSFSDKEDISYFMDKAQRLIDRRYAIC